MVTLWDHLERQIFIYFLSIHSNKTQSAMASMRQNYCEEVKVILRKDNAQEEINKFYQKLTGEIDKARERALENPKASRKSAQGEHLINKSIIEIHKWIFGVINEKDYPDDKSEIEGALRSVLPEEKYLSKKQQKFIRETTVDFGAKEFYFDSNAEVYRAFHNLLHQATINYMTSLLHDQDEDIWNGHRISLVEASRIMNEKEIYVDQMARVKFFKEGEKQKIKEYELTKNAVREMLDRLLYDVEQCAEEIKRITRLLS